MFGCDAPGGRTCHFSVTTPAGVQSFSLPPGGRRAVGGLTPGRDSYVVTYGAANYGDAARCRALAALGGPCRRKIVDAGYND